MIKDIFKNSHIRKNILTGEYVLVSPQRTKRPWQGKQEEKQDLVSVSYDDNCFLCPGNTRANGEKTEQYKDTFIFTNDFSALEKDVDVEKYENGLLQAHVEKGICKVICFSPNHSLTLAKMEVDDIVKVIHTWQNEFKALASIPFVKNIQIFENRGDIMGCSNPHPHGQIWAQATVPNEITRKSENFKDYYDKVGQTLLSKYIAQELIEETRIVYQNEHFVILVPFWAVWPYETMIIPKREGININQMNTNEYRKSFAIAIKSITAAYDKIFNVSFPYSAGIQQAPVGLQDDSGWHWHMSFYPPLLRSASIKKFMVGYEMFAMPQRDITAEYAAEKLRYLMHENSWK